MAGVILSGLIGYQNFIAIRFEDLVVFVFCGIICGIASLCISGASKILESSVFAPIQYIQLIVGFVFAYLFFNDLPDLYEIAGSFIIAGSGLFIIYREYRLGIRSTEIHKTSL